MKADKKDILGFIKIIFNSIILFIVTNIYLFNKGFNLKIPIIISILVIIFLNIFPSLLTKKLYDDNLKKIRNGYRLLIMFLLNILFDIVLYSISYFKYNIDFNMHFQNN